jgi:hypothetical protein
MQEGATPVRSEAEILQAMASGSLQDQRALLIELEAVRGARTASIQETRELDLGGAVMADHLTPVLVHARHTTATDWVLEDDLFAPEVPEGDPAQTAVVEASMWFGRVSPEVKADREEFAEQAMGMARVVAGKYGERAGMAERAFLDHVAHLHSKTANEIDGTAAEDWPLDPDGPMKPSIETGEIDNPAIKTAEVEDWPVDPNVMEKPNVLPWDAPPETTGDAREAAYRRAVIGGRTAAGDSPGKVDKEQSGNAESTITNYDTKADQSPWLFDDWPDEDQTGPAAIHPPMPGAGEATAKIAVDWEMHNPAMDSAIDHMVHVHHIRPDDVTLDPEYEHQRVHKVGPAWKIGEPHSHAASKTAKDEWEQAGQGASTLLQVRVTDPQAEETMWPWEIGETPEEGGPGPTGAGGQDAANVANVPTPGGEAGYPQPKNSKLEAFRVRVQQGLAASR